MIPRWVGRWPGNWVTRPVVELRRVVLRGVERLPVDLGPCNAQQAGLQADTGLAGLVTALEGEGLRHTDH